jgi:hypothetical protein
MATRLKGERTKVCGGSPATRSSSMSVRMQRCRAFPASQKRSHSRISRHGPGLRTLAPDHPQRRLCRIGIGAGLSAQGRGDDAPPRIVAAYDIVIRLGRAEGITVIGSAFGQILVANKLPAEARTVVQQSADMHSKLGRNQRAEEIENLIAPLSCAAPGEPGPATYWDGHKPAPWPRVR